MQGFLTLGLSFLDNPQQFDLLVQPGRVIPFKRQAADQQEKRLAENAKKIKAITSASADALLHVYCKTKPPITLDGIKKCGGSLVRWNNSTCVRFGGREPIDAKETAAIVLCRNDGTPFPAGKTIGERKTHTVGGSVNSWLSSRTTEELQQATTILDVEGVTDWLAVVSVGLPDGWAAVTNTAGAKARSKLARGWAAGKRIIVVGDADEPGQQGQRRSAAAYRRAGAAEVLMGQLPYAVEIDHGKDLRDWLNEGHTITDLLGASVCRCASTRSAPRDARPFIGWVQLAAGSVSFAPHFHEFSGL